MGGMEETGRVLVARFAVIFPDLDERQRRLLMGSEARALGHGGIRLVGRGAGGPAGNGSLGGGGREGRAGAAGLRCPGALMSGGPARSRWAGPGGRAGAASGPPMWIRG